MLIVIRVLVEFFVHAIQNYSEHSFTRKLVQEPVNRCVTSLARAHDQQRSIGPVNQDIRVAEDAQVEPQKQRARYGVWA